MSKRQEVTAIAYNKRGRVLSIGKNSYVVTHTLQAKYANRAGMPESVYIHAEIDALVKARGQQVYAVLVMRHGSDGKPANAKPCKICQLALKDFGVTRVRHT